jgi:hypothetical protein
MRLFAFGIHRLIAFGGRGFGRRRSFGTVDRFRHFRIAPAPRVAMAVTDAATDMATVAVLFDFVGRRRSLRGDRSVRRGLSRRTRRRRGTRDRHLRRGGCRRRSGLLNGRRGSRSRVFGRIGVSRPRRSRMSDDESRGLRGPRLCQSGSALLASTGLPRGDSAARSAGPRGDCRALPPCPRRDSSVADRLVLASKAGNRGAGNQRPALVQRQSNHRQADRGGRAEQRQGRAAGPLEQPVAENARSGGRSQRRLSMFGKHRYVHRPRRGDRQGCGDINPVSIR